MENNENIRHINYASDFRIVFAFADNKLPSYPWHLELKTPNTAAYNTYVASFDGNTYKRCVPLVDNSILVLVDGHKLAPGKLCYALKRDVPDSLFPDGEMNITTPGCTSVVLWDGLSEELPVEQIDTIVATLKGDQGFSAYEVAVRNGFEGTEEEWLASLHGKDANIDDMTVSVDDSVGTPHVEIKVGGTPQARTFDLKFSGLKGETPEITVDDLGNIYSDGILVSDAIKVAIEKSEVQTARAQDQASHPPKIVDVDGLKYWAFWDEATKDYIVSENRAEGGAIMPLFWVDPETLKLYVTYQNGYEGAKFKLENGKLYSIKTIEQ